MKVPLGVECVDSNQQLLARCDKIGRKFLIAKGGEGGHARNNFKCEVHLLIIPHNLFIF